MVLSAIILDTCRSNKPEPWRAGVPYQRSITGLPSLPSALLVRLSHGALSISLVDGGYR
jgi:hypothetical protein